MFRPHLPRSSPAFRSAHLALAGPRGRAGPGRCGVFVGGGARPGGERGAGSRAGELGQRLKIPHGMEEDPAAATGEAAAPPAGCRRDREGAGLGGQGALAEPGRR